MGDDPDAAEPALKAAKLKDLVGVVDYALFLHAFRPPSPERDKIIRELMEGVDKASKKAKDSVIGAVGPLRPYDGTDESLIPSLRAASGSGTVNTQSAFYAIPCAVLLARPALLVATEPMFGGNRDNFTPRSGCRWGRGQARGFPDAAIQAYVKASEEADGHFLDYHGGTMVYALGSARALGREAIRVNPRSLLQGDAPPMDEPYQAWSYISLSARETYLRILPLARVLRDRLATYFTSRGLSADEAARAAHRALFTTVFGASCGGAPPPRTLRKLLLDRAPAEEVRAFLAAGEQRDRERLEAQAKCGAPRDPLMHVAVADAPALPVLWEMARSLDPAEAHDLDLVIDVDARNELGKTPLMTAAQADEVASARWLIEHGAHVDFDTMSTGMTWLMSDGRTALMYAAARGSLEMIRLLVEAGADTHRADTKGVTALGYLLGQGPMGPNPRLTAAQRADAVRLLW